MDELQAQQNSDNRLKIDVPDDLSDEFVDRLRQREEELARLMQITERINRGLALEEILDFLYEEMRSAIPYDRVGLALIDPQRRTVISRWSRSDGTVLLRQGYAARLRGSSLQQIVDTGQPRIINDLEAYLEEKPDSQSTMLIVDEGLRSSLTCPLIVQGRPVGFVFFSSTAKDTYRDVHVAFFQQIAGQLSTIVEKGRLYDELAEQKATVERQNVMMTDELEMARRVQRALIPALEPDVPGLDVAFVYEPVQQVGGDILDIIPLGDGRVLLFVADAMGHGIQAALVMSVVKAALGSAVESDPRPEKVLAEINHVVTRLFDDRFVTAACCLIDSHSRRAELALAGHSAPLWYRAGMKNVAQHNRPSLPLCISKDTEYCAAPIALGTGDVLVFSTDGITEAFDRDGNQYGDERLKDCLLRHADSSAGELSAAIRRDLDAHCGDRRREDDLTLLVVKCLETQDRADAGEPPLP